jgi:hypothetical protein
MKPLLAIVVTFATIAAHADVFTFESPTYSGSATGTILTGQDNWYIPVVGSGDWNVHTYASNALGLAALPFVGSAQFIGAKSDLGAFRAQRDFDFGSSPVWTAHFYLNCKYGGDLQIAPAQDNLGSFSLQPTPDIKYWQTLYTWVDPLTAQNYRCFYIADNSAGTQFTLPGHSPGASMSPDPWANLSVNRWYRISTTWRFSDNKILCCAITDMVTGDTKTAVPPFGSDGNWYLRGGPSSVLPLPTAFRAFVGAGENVNGVDHITLTPGMLAVPTSAVVTTGNPQGPRDVRLLFEDDDQRLELIPGIVFSSVQSPLVMTVKATVPTTNPTALTVTIESSATSIAVAQSLDILNVTNAQYEAIDTHNLTTTDTTSNYVFTVNPSRFVDPTTREVTMRIRARTTAVVFSFPWRLKIDRVLVTGTP